MANPMTVLRRVRIENNTGLANDTKVTIDGVEIPCIYKIVLNPIEANALITAAIYLEVSLDVLAKRVATTTG